jgi:hypothetical protein
VKAVLRSPTFRQPATAATAIVLVWNDDEWSTHLENQEATPYTHNGHYFGSDYAAALADFYVRCESWATLTRRLIEDGRQAVSVDVPLAWTWTEVA